MQGFTASGTGDNSFQNWRKSSRSYGTGQCIEVSGQSGDRIQVRDSANPRGTVLQFTQAGWATFLSTVRSELPLS